MISVYGEQRYLLTDLNWVQLTYGRNACIKVNITAAFSFRVDLTLDAVGKNIMMFSQAGLEEDEVIF